MRLAAGRTAVALAASLATWPAAAQADWAKLSPDVVAQFAQPDWGYEPKPGVGLVASWPATTGTSATAREIQVRGFLPNLRQPTALAGTTGTPVAGWNAINPSPVLVGRNDDPADPRRTNPASELLFQALSDSGDGGTFQAGPVWPAGGTVPLAKRTPGRTGDLDAVSVLDGGKAGILWADSSNGLSTYRDTGAPTAAQSTFQSALGGGDAYHPSLGVQSDGRVWLLWYSNASGNTGLYMAPLDPATGAASGPTVKVPGSETPANNFARMPLACRTTCRVFYATGATSTKLASWAPGDAAPAIVPGAQDTGILNSIIAATPAPAAGRTWVVWYDHGKKGFGPGFRGKLADDRGLGAKVFPLGIPKGATRFGPLQVVPIADQLLVMGVAGSGETAVTGQAVWNDVTTETGDPNVAWTHGFKSARVARAAGATAIVAGSQSRTTLRRKGLAIRLENLDPGKVVIKVLGRTPGHPPSPIKTFTTTFARPGIRDLRFRLSKAIVAHRSLRVTLTAGGQTRTLTTKGTR